jgi:hypothetical protein
MGIIRLRFPFVTSVAALLARLLWDLWDEETAKGIVGLPRLLLDRVPVAGARGQAETRIEPGRVQSRPASSKLPRRFLLR